MIAKFDGLEPWRCEDMKGIVAPEIGPKSFGTFEKQAPGLLLITKISQVKILQFIFVYRRLSYQGTFH